MGWSVHSRNTALYCVAEERDKSMTHCPSRACSWNPATSLDQAWQIVETLQEKEYWLTVTAGKNGQWEPSSTVEVGRLYFDGTPKWRIAEVSGDTVPRMICQMALVALLGL